MIDDRRGLDLEVVADFAKGGLEGERDLHAGGLELTHNRELAVFQVGDVVRVEADVRVPLDVEGVR